MASLEDFQFAIGMRDVMERLVARILDRDRPIDRYGTVVSIDRVNYKCVVTLLGEGNITVNMGAIQPLAAGQRVRISGNTGDRYIDAVLGGGAAGINASNVYRIVYSGSWPARPTGITYVEWVGPSAPPGAISGDTWINSA